MHMDSQSERAFDFGIYIALADRTDSCLWAGLNCPVFLTKNANFLCFLLREHPNLKVLTLRMTSEQRKKTNIVIICQV